MRENNQQSEKFENDSRCLFDRNYLKINRPSLRYSYFCFFDTAEYLADGLFVQNQVPVRYCREYVHPDHPFLIILCKVKKGDEGRFVEALVRLSDKMLLLGHRDYDGFCRSFMERIEKQLSVDQKIDG